MPARHNKYMKQFIIFEMDNTKKGFFCLVGGSAILVVENLRKNTYVGVSSVNTRERTRIISYYIVRKHHVCGGTFKMVQDKMTMLDTMNYLVGPLEDRREDVGCEMLLYWYLRG